MGPHAFTRHRRIWLAAAHLVALTAVFSVLLPTVSSCCLMNGSCCPQDADLQEGLPLLGGPVPACCEQMVPDGRSPLGERAAPVRVAAAVATLPDVSDAAILQVSFRPADAPGQAPVERSRQPRSARAPPLS